jgi:Ternary complex associated domain 9
VWRKLLRSDQIFWGTVGAAIGGVALAVLAILLATPRYELLAVPISAWYVLILCGLILALIGVAVRYRRLWRRADREVVLLNTQPPAELLPAVCGHSLLQAPEFVPLIQALFRPPPHVTHIQLEPLSGGHGGSITLEACLRDAESEEPLSQRFVVKLGNRAEVEGEVKNYHEFVSAALVGQEILYRQAVWGDHAAVAYKFVGLAPGDAIMTFDRFYSSAHSHAESVALVEQIYARLRGAWYRRGRIVTSDLFKEYGLLAEKRTQIGQAIAAIVEDGDPYRRTNLNRTESPWPTGRPAFCRQPDLPWYDPLAFLNEWREKSLTLPIHRATIHGDLNARNVLVEIAKDARKLPWFIDFSHTGNGLSVARRVATPAEGGADDLQHGPTLYDFCRLEADLKVLSTRLANPGDLEMAVQADAALLSYEGDWGDFPDSPPPSDAWADERFRKLWHVVAAIRRQAAGYLADPTDQRPYHLGLLRATLPAVYYQSEQFGGGECERQQKRFALLSAGMLCGRLSR